MEGRQKLIMKSSWWRGGGAVTLALPYRWVLRPSSVQSRDKERPAGGRCGGYKICTVYMGWLGGGWGDTNLGSVPGTVHGMVGEHEEGGGANDGSHEGGGD
jgi:hypothetical protein